ncbi:MAG: sarcosine oxidase subunit gamma family protein [Chloroflexota bacterium]|nr:sarcosine oxidase subunit gamma family protein [Chloroflexota bacterium]
MSNTTHLLYEEESPLWTILHDDNETRQLNESGILISEHSKLGQVNLRGPATDSLFTTTVKDILDVEIPTEPNTVSSGGKYIVLWLGENEWLVITQEDQQTNLIKQLGNKLNGMSASITDLSSGQIILRMTGPSVRNVLSKGCTLDLHPRSFGVGECAQTLIAEVGVTMRQIDDTPSFELIVRRSLAEYLCAWLIDAAQKSDLTQ